MGQTTATAPLSDSQLDEIRARAEAAVPGPWEWMGNTETKQIYLGTMHSGRLYIVSPRTVWAEHVHSYRWEDSVDLDYARKNIKRLLPSDTPYCPECDACIADGAEHDSDCETPDWQPEAHPMEGRVREFLAREQDHFHPETMTLTDDDGAPLLERYVTWHTELQFQDHKDDEVGLGGRMVDASDIVRYEVLDGQTRAEAGLDRDAGRSNSPLYREDFFGIDNPDATFLAHAREDIDRLLAEIDRLRSERGE